MNDLKSSFNHFYLFRFSELKSDQLRMFWGRYWQGFQVTIQNTII